MSVAESSYGEQKCLQFLQSVIEQDQPSRILGIGCGLVTYVIFPLAKAFPTISFLGIDCDAYSIACVQRQNTPDNHMNLSHYQSLDPDVDRGNCQTCVQAGGHALPADPQATRRLLEPRTGPLGWEPRDDVLERPATVFLGLPNPLGELGPHTTLAPLVAQRFGLRAFLRRQDLQALPGTTAAARAARARSKAWPHLRPLVSMGQRGAVRQGPTLGRGEAVEQPPLALPPAGDALAPPGQGANAHKRAL